MSCLHSVALLVRETAISRQTPIRGEGPTIEKDMADGKIWKQNYCCPLGGTSDLGMSDDKEYCKMLAINQLYELPDSMEDEDQPISSSDKEIGPPI